MLIIQCVMVFFFIQSLKIQNTLVFLSNKVQRILMEKTFEMLKEIFLILFKEMDISLPHMSNLVTTYICLHNMCKYGLHVAG